MRGATNTVRPMDDIKSISIHAPHARSDSQKETALKSILAFQSTLLMRGATEHGGLHPAGLQNFNPRSSCEERRGRRSCRSSLTTFQSTLLMRGATSDLHDSLRMILTISIHAPHARSDATAWYFTTTHPHFNPRSSCEERHFHLAGKQIQIISIHAPHARSDCHMTPIFTMTHISIHAPHARSDTTV